MDCQVLKNFYMAHVQDVSKVHAVLQYKAIPIFCKKQIISMQSCEPDPPFPHEGTEDLMKSTCKLLNIHLNLQTSVSCSTFLPLHSMLLGDRNGDVLGHVILLLNSLLQSDITWSWFTLVADKLKRQCMKA